MFGLVELQFRFHFISLFVLGGTLIFSLSHILSSLVNVRLHTENWLCNLPGSASKAHVVVVRK